MAAANLHSAPTVAGVHPLALMASSTPWPAVLAGVAVVVAVCLWLLFRRGSMAHRARVDHPEGDERAAPADADDGLDDGPAPGSDQRPAGGR
jgi:hypothetical protein